MEYILTQKEYDALTPVKRLQERNEALEVAREIIIKLSKYPCGKTYCDMCPISDIGGEPGEFRPARKLSKQICIKNRSYSK